MVFVGWICLGESTLGLLKAGVVYQNAYWGSSGTRLLAVRFFQQNLRMGSKSRLWLSECLLGLIWQRVFGGEIFVAKSTLGLKKQLLFLRMPTGAHLAKGFCRFDFSSKIDAWASKSRCCL